MSSQATETGTKDFKLVELTTAAIAEVKRLSTEEANAGLGLRLGVKGGGCSGLSYVLDFTEAREGDTVLDQDGVTIYLDRKSTIYLSGVVLDHQSGLAGKGFVFNNPMASNTCGCGESFAI